MTTKWFNVRIESFVRIPISTPLFDYCLIFQNLTNNIKKPFETKQPQFLKGIPR